ncbi:hypothetical protein BDZ97DRAFT_1784240 [Flammula alnicola]|nr:hypothetical protein BDZ97DRAFT_1784240 [Flammula alnicola]
MHLGLSCGMATASIHSRMICGAMATTLPAQYDGGCNGGEGLTFRFKGGECERPRSCRFLSNDIMPTWDFHRSLSSVNEPDRVSALYLSGTCLLRFADAQPPRLNELGQIEF